MLFFSVTEFLEKESIGIGEYMETNQPINVVRSLFSSPSDRSTPSIEDCATKADSSDDEISEKRVKGMEMSRTAMESPICIKQHVEEVHEVARMMQPLTRLSRLAPKETAILG